MSKQFFTNALEAFTKANKARKQVLAERAGYSNPEDYKEFLKNSTMSSTETKVPTKKTSKTKELPKVLVVDVMDCSASMRGAKMRSAAEGINDLIKKMKEETNVAYEYSLCTFSGRGQFWLSEPVAISSVSKQVFQAMGNTALYSSVMKVIDAYKDRIGDGSKVLVNIYTDGEDNDSDVRPDTLFKKIKEYEKKGFTFTFIGTERDVQYINRTVGIDLSNMASYDGSAKGLQAVMDTVSVSRAVYSSNVAQGKDVTKGFFKNIKIK